MKIVVVASHSGGHICPAIAFSQELKTKDKNTEIVFITTDGHIEKELIKDDYNVIYFRREKSTISNLYKLKDKTQLIFKYHEMIGQSSEEADHFINNIDIDSIPYKSLFSMLMSHYDLRLPENYKFRPSYLSKKLGLEESIVRTILDEFSYKWGGLESHETEYIFLSNPVWLRPIIKLETGEYFCVFPQVFFAVRN